MPVEVIGSLAWGGENLDVLYVTSFSAPRDLDTGAPSNITISPGSGKIFAVTGLNANGLPGRSICI